jgi:hypothetical protein
MMATTAKEAVKEKIDYETTLRQRDARIEQCRKVELVGEQKNKTEIEMKRKQEALEHQRVEEQKFTADADSKRQAEELERRRKEAQKEQKLKADAEALELHKRTMALEKEREDQLKAEAEALNRETDKLERERSEISTRLETQRQLELEKDRQKALQDKIEADKERRVILERQRQLEEAQVRQGQIKDQSAAEKEHQAKIKDGLEETQRVQNLKSGKTVVTSFRDAELKYEPINGDDYVERPPTVKPDEKRYLLLSGAIETQNKNIIVCRYDSEYDSPRESKIRKWGFIAQGMGSYVPRIGEQVRAIGKISDVIKATTVRGIPFYMIVLQAVAIETEDGQFHQP